jgi:adenylate cyclase class 1
MHIFATAEHGVNNSTAFNIYCGQHEFLAVDWGEELYSTVARFILAQRKSRSRHNCYISDLDLSRIKTLDGFEVQTSDYIYYKQIIEQLIDVSLQTA